MNKASISNIDSAGLTVIEHIREYWNKNPHEYQVSKHPPGTIDYFNDIKAYYEKKHGYLNGAIDYRSLEGKRILEIGCGLGNELVKLANSGAIVTGIDISDFAVEMSRKNVEIRNLKAQVYRTDGEYMEYEDESFDVVFAISSIPYTPNPEKMIQEIHRVLKKEHEAYLVLYNSDSWLNLLFKTFNSKSYREEAPVFKQHKTEELKSLLSSFSEVRITTDRFPIKADRDNKIQTVLYNKLFVPAFNLIPKRFLKSYGHHIIVKVVK